MADEGECLDELEDLLVPVTVLSTKEDLKNNQSSDQQLRSVKNISNQTNGKRLNGKNDLEDEDEEDEFEDEGELEGGNNGTEGVNTTRTGRQVRQPLIMPMPVMKRASLSLQEKVEIIQELEKGEKQSSICKKKRLAKSTVQSIWKNRLKIIEATEKIGLSRKRCRRAQHENVEDKLVEWMETLKSQNVPVNGPQLRAKAQVFAKQLGIEEFRSSTGWLDKFKTRHSIAFKKSGKGHEGSSGSSSGSNSGGVGDKKFAIDWVTKIWPNLCEGYTAENIFNLDEFGLFFHALPDQVNKLVNETCHGGRLAQDRLTVLSCVNSDGSEKRKLAVVGSYELRGSINLKNLPVSYYEDPNSWMTRTIFEEELKKWDLELGAAGRNVLLILDNSPAHRVDDTAISNIKLVYLPPIVASILQPLEHGVIQDIKLQYRRFALDKIIRRHQAARAEQHNNNNFGHRNTGAELMEISVMDAIVMLSCAWTSVESSDISECFKNSNLQSINVSDTPTHSNSSARIQAQSRLDADLMEKVISCVPNLHIPANFSLRSYSEVDNKLHVVDYINEDTRSSKSASAHIFTAPPPEVSSKVQVLEFLSRIRNWIMTLPEDIEDNSNIHESISILENFAIRQPNQAPPASHHNHHQHHLFQIPPVPSCNPRQNNQNSTSRIVLNGPHHTVSGIQPIQQQSHGVMTSGSAPLGPNSNASNATTVVTFTLADSLQQPNVPHHLIDQQQFFAYLS